MKELYIPMKEQVCIEEGTECVCTEVHKYYMSVCETRVLKRCREHQSLGKLYTGVVVTLSPSL